jgi:hypothetical protein
MPHKALRVLLVDSAGDVGLQCTKAFCIFIDCSFRYVTTHAATNMPQYACGVVVVTNLGAAGAIDLPPHHTMFQFHPSHSAKKVVLSRT